MQKDADCGQRGGGMGEGKGAGWVSAENEGSQALYMTGRCTLQQ